MASAEATPIEQPIFSGKIFSERLFELIDSASEDICLSTYIFAPDPFAREIFEALRQKASLGIVVRLLVDGFGSIDWLQSQAHGSLPETFEVRIFHPYPKLFAKSAQFNLHWLNRFFDSLSKANRRNHQKLLIVDDKVLLTGSRNIHQEALIWRETSLICGNPLAEQAQIVFDHTWRLSWAPEEKRLSRFGENIKARRQGLRLQGNLLSNHTRSLRRSRNQRVLELMKNCKRRLWITTPYFFPPKKVIRIFKELTQNQVQVVLLLPLHSDVWVSKMMAKLFYRELQSTGVMLIEYNERILHAKSMICDDTVVIGSANLNRRSFLRDLEVDCIVTDPGCVKDFEGQFIKDRSHSASPDLKSRLGWLQWIFAKVLSWVVPDSF
jgi:cardiolipin synthase